jgi:hypothetical protein
LVPLNGYLATFPLAIHALGRGAHDKRRGMYFLFVVLLTFILPVASVAVEATRFGADAGLMFLIGKWFVFWAVGVRLLVAGIRQVAQPRFTAEGIFDIKDPAADPMVREIGFGNLAIGALGFVTLWQPAWLVPAAIVGGLYYGLAGAGHAFRSDRNFNEQTALVTDLLILAVLAIFVVVSVW